MPVQYSDTPRPGSLQPPAPSTGYSCHYSEPTAGTFLHSPPRILFGEWLPITGPRHAHRGLGVG